MDNLNQGDLLWGMPHLFVREYMKTTLKKMYEKGDFVFHEEDVSEVSNVYCQINQGRMEIVLDALRMLDDGLIKKTGPLSSIKSGINQEGNGSEKNGGKGLPSIRGPLSDYLYVGIYIIMFGVLWSQFAILCTSLVQGTAWCGQVPEPWPGLCLNEPLLHRILCARY